MWTERSVITELGLVGKESRMFGHKGLRMLSQRAPDAPNNPEEKRGIDKTKMNHSFDVKHIPPHIPQHIPLRLAPRPQAVFLQHAQPGTAYRVEPDNYIDLIHKYPLLVFLDDSLYDPIWGSLINLMGWSDTFRLASCSYPMWGIVLTHLPSSGVDFDDSLRFMAAGTSAIIHPLF
ncbi:hypothetical protein C8J57DRAFT_1251674 [Mycena rebaudengoi]|nr:hypothetical protein C8J57DRAFT_1251674 [Mycena rebaudengoi]